MAKWCFYHAKKEKEGEILIFLSVNLAAPVSHVKFSEQGVRITLELKRNVVNTAVCARIAMSQGHSDVWNTAVKAKTDARCHF